MTPLQIWLAGLVLAVGFIFLTMFADRVGHDR